MNKKQDHWSSYWAEGYLTSLPEDFRINYDGELRQWWDEVFSRLPANAAVLDLCTGNGAVALLAAEYGYRNNRRYFVSAIDASRIDLDGVLRRYNNADLEKYYSKITFMGGRSVENPGLRSCSYDLITSQYGVEYTDWQQSALEIERMLKPGGLFSFVSHAADSDMAIFMKKESREYDGLNRWGFYAALDSYLNGKCDVQRTQKSLRKVKSHILQLRSSKRGPLLKATMRVIKQLLVLDDAGFARNRQALARYQLQHQHARKRTKDILHVTELIEGSPQWFEVFDCAGLKLIAQKKILQRGRFFVGEAYLYYKI